MYGAVVLAAGDSTRMGRPKALLDYRGTTALELVLAAARSAAAHVVVVLGRHAPLIEQQIDLSTVTVVRNADPAAGRTGSLQVGVRALPAGVEAFFVHPVDVPLVGAADFLALQAAREADPAGSLFVATYAGKGGHPLLVDSQYRNDILVMGVDTPLRALLEAHPDAVRRIPVPNPGILLNVNTPEEYERSLSLDAAGRAVHAAKPPC